MSEKQINDGGPAFPQPIASTPSGDPMFGTAYWDCGGLTVRDYFAAKAMQGYMASENFSLVMANGKFSHEDASGMFYQWADYMLAARSQGDPDV